MSYTKTEAAGTVVLALLAAFLIAGWACMLLIGIIHADILPAVHPVGYGVSLLVVLLARVSMSRASK